MTQPVREQLEAFLHNGDQAIWSTAALVLALQGAASDEQQAAAHAVLEASGLDGVPSLEPRMPAAWRRRRLRLSIRSLASFEVRDRCGPRSRTRP